MKKTTRNVLVLVLVLALVIVGIKFGLVMGLLGAAIAAFCLKRFGVVSADSAWVSETKGVRTAKYILLALVLIGLGWFAYVALGQ